MRFSHHRLHPASCLASIALAVALVPAAQAGPAPYGHVRANTNGSTAQDVQLDIVDRGLWLRDSLGSAFEVYATAGATPTVGASVVVNSGLINAGADASYTYFFHAVDLTDPTQALTLDLSYSFAFNVTVDPGSHPDVYMANMTVSVADHYTACGELSRGFGSVPCPYNGRDQVQAPGAHTLQATVAGDVWTKVNESVFAEYAGRQYGQDTGSANATLGPILITVDPAWIAAHPNDAVSIEYATAAAAVPEVATSALWLAGLGALGVPAMRRRGRKGRP